MNGIFACILTFITNELEIVLIAVNKSHDRTGKLRIGRSVVIINLFLVVNGK